MPNSTHSANSVFSGLSHKKRTALLANNMKNFFKLMFGKKLNQYFFAGVIFLLVCFYGREYIINIYTGGNNQYLECEVETFAPPNSSGFKIEIEKAKFKDKVLDKYLERNIYAPHTSNAIETEADFKTLKQNNKDDGIGFYTTILRTVNFYSPDILTIIFYTEAFGYQAHPNHFHEIINYNVKTKKIITFADLDSVNTKNRVLTFGSEIAQLNTSFSFLKKDIMNAVIERLSEFEDFDENLRNYAAEGLSSNSSLTNFYIVKKDVCAEPNSKFWCFDKGDNNNYSLVIIFNEYSVAPYIYGATEIEIPLNKKLEGAL